MLGADPSPRRTGTTTPSASARKRRTGKPLSCDRAAVDGPICSRVWGRHTTAVGMRDPLESKEDVLGRACHSAPARPQLSSPPSVHQHVRSLEHDHHNLKRSVVRCTSHPAPRANRVTDNAPSWIILCLIARVEIHPRRPYCKLGWAWELGSACALDNNVDCLVMPVSSKTMSMSLGPSMYF